MQIKKWVFCCFIILAALAGTNPSKDDFNAWAKVKLMQNSENGLLSLVVGIAGRDIFDSTTDRKNLLIFSIYRTSFGDGKILTLGIAGNFFELNHDSKSKKDAEKRGENSNQSTKYNTLNVNNREVAEDNANYEKKIITKVSNKPNLSMEFSTDKGGHPVWSGVKGVTQLLDMSDTLNCNADITAGIIEQVQFSDSGRSNSFLLRQYKNDSVLKIDIDSSDKLSEAEASWLDKLVEPKSSVIVLYVRCGASGHVAYATDIFYTKNILPEVIQELTLRSAR